MHFLWGKCFNFFQAKECRLITWLLIWLNKKLLIKSVSCNHVAALVLMFPLVEKVVQVEGHLWSCFACHALIPNARCGRVHMWPGSTPWDSPLMPVLQVAHFICFFNGALLSTWYISGINCFSPAQKSISTPSQKKGNIESLIVIIWKSNFLQVINRLIRTYFLAIPFYK